MPSRFLEEAKGNRSRVRWIWWTMRTWLIDIIEIPNKVNYTSGSWFFVRMGAVQTAAWNASLEYRLREGGFWIWPSSTQVTISELNEQCGLDWLTFLEFPIKSTKRRVLGSLSVTETVHSTAWNIILDYWASKGFFLDEVKGGTCHDQWIWQTVQWWVIDILKTPNEVDWTSDSWFFVRTETVLSAIWNTIRCVWVG